MSVTEAVLEINPDSVLQFTLSAADDSPVCVLELRHPDPKAAPIAFKVKTTQPRRYLVRPNQGLIQPGETQDVQILLVAKDKNSLMQSFQRLGQSALDHSKDKFLVQSVAVFDSELEKALVEYEQLTALWAAVGQQTSNNNTSAVANKKLHVRHTVLVEGKTAMPPSPEAAKAEPPVNLSREPVDALSKDQLVEELSTLRRKYDELVAFSVNLTAERDMLNNTLEQTKRDLNRQVAKSAATDNLQQHPRRMDSAAANSGKPNTLVVAVLVLVALLVGIKLEQMGLVSSIPVIGSGNSVEDEL